MMCELELKVYRLLTRQLDSLFGKEFYSENNIKKYIPIALKQMKNNFQKAVSKRLYDQEMIFNPLDSLTWMIFLYRMSRVAYLNNDIPTADSLYYLNKSINANDWFYQVNLPIHFLAEHPLGSVLGKAEYGDFFFVYQGTTVGGNRRGGRLWYPVLGKNVIMYANSTVLGDCKIGNNVVIAANSFLINEYIPDNCIVFGSSPNVTIKGRTEEEIKQMTEHIWKW